MNFGNNIERMGFEKGGWSLIEVHPDGTVYKGKTSNPDAKIDEPCWFIMKITQNKGKDDVDYYEITIAYPLGGCKWTEKESYRYKYI